MYRGVWRVSQNFIAILLEFVINPIDFRLGYGVRVKIGHTKFFIVVKVYEQSKKDYLVHPLVQNMESASEELHAELSAVVGELS